MENWLSVSFCCFGCKSFRGVARGVDVPALLCARRRLIRCWLVSNGLLTSHLSPRAPGSCPGGRRRSRCCTCLAMTHGRFDSCSEHTHARSHACTSLLLLHARLGTTGCSIDRLFDRPLLHPHSYSCSLASSLLPSGGWGWMVVGRQASKHGGMCSARGGLCCGLTRRPRASPGVNF